MQRSLAILRRFSLIELLVVVSIVIVLISLIAPALQSYLSTTRKITCAQNLRQLYNLEILYSDDYQNHTTPVFTNSFGLGAYHTSWVPLLFVLYVDPNFPKNSNYYLSGKYSPFNCPEQESSMKINGSPQLEYSYAAVYRQEGPFPRYPETSMTPRSIKMSQVAQDTLFFMDGKSINSPTNAESPTPADGPLSLTGTTNWARHHNPGANFVFATGSVAHYAYGEITKAVISRYED